MSNEEQLTQIRLSMLTLPLHWAICNIPLHRLSQRHSGHHWLSFVSSVFEHISVINALLRFINFVGISYQLPGSFSDERALLLTEHMKAMGLLDSARYVYEISTLSYSSVRLIS
jgi:hypothetical protein